MIYQVGKKNRGKVPIAVILLGLLIIFLAATNFNLYWRDRKLNRKLKSIEGEMGIQNEKKASIEKNLAEMQEFDYGERLVREKGMYKRPGEDIVVILKKEATSANSQGVPENIFVEIWQNIRNIFR
ncbi:MAG TPA: hypothetical protein PKM84_01270 [Candidatus Pacearchaeota archaeon]|nr:hypothetical protein [Candidatus Pacearchaeota archaeon]